MVHAIELALLDKRPDLRLEELRHAGVLRDLCPEVAAMVGFGGGDSGHKDLWSHTKRVVAQAAPRREVRWAALFHDVGKVNTFSREKGKVSFHRHEFVSAMLFHRAAKRFELEATFRKHVRFLVRHLGLVEAYDPEWTDSAVRRLHREVGYHFADLLDLARADVTTKHEQKRTAYRARINELELRAFEIAFKDAQAPPLPKGLGAAIMQAFDTAPGPRIGELKAQLEAAINRGELPARAEPDVYITFLAGRPE